MLRSILSKTDNVRANNILLPLTDEKERENERSNCMIDASPVPVRVCFCSCDFKKAQPIRNPAQKTPGGRFVKGQTYSCKEERSFVGGIEQVLVIKRNFPGYRIAPPSP